MTRHQLPKLDMTKRETRPSPFPMCRFYQSAGWSDIFLTYTTIIRAGNQHLMRQLVLKALI